MIVQCTSYHGGPPIAQISKSEFYLRQRVFVCNMTIQDDKHQKKEKNTKICQQNKFQHNITSVTVHNANIQSVLTLTKFSSKKT